MNCPECRELLQRRLDGEGIRQSTVEAHLLLCDACRSQWEAADRLEQGLIHISRPMPSPQLVARVLAANRREQVKRHRSSWIRAAVAAALLVAPWLAVQGFRQAEAPHVVQAPPPGDSMRGLQFAVAGVGGRLLDLTQEQAEVVQAVAAPLEAATVWTATHKPGTKTRPWRERPGDCQQRHTPRLELLRSLSD